MCPIFVWIKSIDGKGRVRSLERNRTLTSKVRRNPGRRASSLDWLPAAIKHGSAVRELAAGEILFREGDSARAIFEVEEGRLRLLRQTIDGRTVVIQTVGPSELFAEAALFASRYQCDAVAAIASRVRSYSKREVLAAVREDPKLAVRFMALLALQVQTLRSRLEQRNIRSARERLLNHLALAAGPHGRTVTLAGTLMDLAAEVGLTHETLYRTIAGLEKEGMIVRAAGTVTLQS